MRQRGGGILDIELRDKSDLIEDYYQLHITFETVDSMGANFINSCLEKIAKTLQKLAADHDAFLKEQLSNCSEPNPFCSESIEMCLRSESIENASKGIDRP